MPDTEKKSLMGFILERFKIQVVSASILFITSTAAIVATPVGEHVKSIWNSPNTLDQISEKLDLITTEVMRATGEDRVMIESPGLSYVVEPVYRGDEIILSMVLRRTKAGAGCISLERTPLFTDETNIATVGLTEETAQQLTVNETPARIRLTVPEQVRGGRVTVHLSYKFDCGGVIIFEPTRPVAFMLQERQ